MHYFTTTTTTTTTTIYTTTNTTRVYISGPRANHDDFRALVLTVT